MPDSAAGPPERAAPTNRREALEAVAERVGGELVEGKKLTGGYAVVVEDGPWTLTLDMHMVSTGNGAVMHTRAFTHFSSREDLKLRVRRRGLLDRIAGVLGFGRQDYGHRAMAREHVVRGRPDSRVRSILSGGLAEAIARAPAVSLEVKRAPRRVRKTMGPQARRLQVLVPGVDTDVERMVGMLTLVREALDVLKRSGAAVAS